ncbi:hypothetical protein [Couchioplanes caeruleus]|uniref:Uncharacterized protein n=1 Tax=Couchioplanes caeruleus TaxID=56438 RepID=A0A3N1GHC5_9ACTN|nr:hypothetical protein [Couchioplanes caeruleus]ROP29521.1 hypothetical protein EDD30_2318 [Couchioplanes caeruleus]
MAKREYGHRLGRNGKPQIVETTLPRHLRGYDEYSVHSFTEGPIKRLLSRKHGR